MVLALAWKLRWAMIRPTSSSDKSTLESSKEEERKLPKVPVLGDLAPFPQGPWILASLLGCPVYTIFCVRAERNRYDVFIEPFADKITLPGKQRETKLHDWICCYALNLEKYCCRFPHHWFNFYDFWSRSSKTSR